MNLPTDPEKRFSQLEKVIEKGMNHFVEVGTALMIIRDEKLYKDTFRTFKEYCKERWGFSRIQAYRLIKAYNVSGNLLPMGNKPTSERQLRPLTHLEPEQQKQVWNQAVKTAPNGKVTARHVEKVIDELEMASSEDMDESEEPEQMQDSPTIQKLKHYWNLADRQEKEIFINWIKGGDK
jgi:hypothetical protein